MTKFRIKILNINLDIGKKTYPKSYLGKEIIILNINLLNKSHINFYNIGSIIFIQSGEIKIIYLR